MLFLSKTIKKGAEKLGCSSSPLPVVDNSVYYDEYCSDCVDETVIHHTPTASTTGVTGDTFPIDFNTLFLLTSTTDIQTN